MTRAIKRGERFAFAEGQALREEDLNEEKTEWLIPDLLVKNSITMWYSKPSQGKTWFSYAVAKKILCSTPPPHRLFYCDFDNGKRQLKERNVHKELLPHENFYYLHKGKVEATTEEFIARIDKECYGQHFKECVFVFDSTRDFVDNIHNDMQAKRFMQIMKNIREAGGTVILIHHTSKSGRVIDGSGEFTKSTDNAFELKQTGKTPGKLHYLLKVTNDRDSVKECAFTVNLKTLDLGELDPVMATMTTEDKAAVQKIIDALKEKEMSQTEVIAVLGHDRTHRPSRELLQKYTGVFWNAQKRGKPIYYTTI